MNFEQYGVSQELMQECLENPALFENFKIELTNNATADQLLDKTPDVLAEELVDVTLGENTYSSRVGEVFAFQAVYNKVKGSRKIAASQIEIDFDADYEVVKLTDLDGDVRNDILDAMNRLQAGALNILDQDGNLPAVIDEENNVTANDAIAATHENFVSQALQAGIEEDPMTEEEVRAVIDGVHAFEDQTHLPHIESFLENTSSLINSPGYWNGTFRQMGRDIFEGNLGVSLEDVRFQLIQKGDPIPEYATALLDNARKTEVSARLRTMFNRTMRGYRPEIQQYEHAHYKMMAVNDDVGTYVYFAVTNEYKVGLQLEDHAPAQIEQQPLPEGLEEIQYGHDGVDEVTPPAENTVEEEVVEQEDVKNLPEVVEEQNVEITPIDELLQRFNGGRRIAGGWDTVVFDKDDLKIKAVNISNPSDISPDDNASYIATVVQNGQSENIELDTFDDLQDFLSKQFPDNTIKSSV